MDIADIKKELSNDEKILESAFKLETIYKKYKLIIWAVAIGLVLFFVGRAVMDTLERAKLEDANKAFLALQENPEDTKSLSTLKDKNPSLYEMYIYSQAVNKSDKKVLSGLVNSGNDIVADASKYTLSVLDSKPQNSKLYGDMALFEEAYLALKSGNIAAAKAKLSEIDEKSPLSKVANLLKHATLTKGK